MQDWPEPNPGDWYGLNLNLNVQLCCRDQQIEEPVYTTRSLSIKMPNLHFPSFAQAEQIARKKTYSEKLLRGAESLFYIPPNPVICKKNASDWAEFHKNYYRIFPA